MLSGSTCASREICALDLLIDVAVGEAEDMITVHDRLLERREDLFKLDMQLTAQARRLQAAPLAFPPATAARSICPTRSAAVPCSGPRPRPLDAHQGELVLRSSAWRSFCRGSLFAIRSASARSRSTRSFAAIAGCCATATAARAASPSNIPPPDARNSEAIGGSYVGKGVAGHLAEAGGERGFRDPIVKAIAAYFGANGAGADPEAIKRRIREAIARAVSANPGIRPGKRDLKRYASDQHLDEIIDWTQAREQTKPEMGFR
jgi:hypothetical protein